MTKRFAIGFGIGLLLFLAINPFAAHLASDCGLLAVFGRDTLGGARVCADDIARAGWPMQFYEEGGFAYHRDFDSTFLTIDIVVGGLFSMIPDWIHSHSKKPLPK
jgi:hypothetical protein